MKSLLRKKCLKITNDKNCVVHLNIEESPEKNCEKKEKQKNYKMPLYEPVALYHVTSGLNSPDFSDEEIDEDDEVVDERQSFISYRGGIGTRRIATSHGKTIQIVIIQMCK